MRRDLSKLCFQFRALRRARALVVLDCEPQVLLRFIRMSGHGAVTFDGEGAGLGGTKVWLGHDSSVPSRYDRLMKARSCPQWVFSLLRGRGAAGVPQAHVLDHTERADREGLPQHEGDAE